jgi:hypothetical protein
MYTIPTAIPNTWFKNGVDASQEDGYRKVGYYSWEGATFIAVMRYKFTTTSTITSKINLIKASFDLDVNYVNNKIDNQIMFYITDDPDSHKYAYYVAGRNEVAYDGYLNLTRETGTGYYTGTGSVEKTLLPNTDYYLYLFADFTSNKKILYTVYNSAYITIELESAEAKIVMQIDLGNSFVSVVPCIDMGNTWKTLQPYIENGYEWKTGP